MKQSEPFSMCCGSSSVFERTDVVYKYASNKRATSLGVLLRLEFHLRIMKDDTYLGICIFTMTALILTL